MKHFCLYRLTAIRIQFSFKKKYHHCVWGSSGNKRKEYEMLILFCMHTDPYTGKDNKRYLEGPFFTVKRTKNNNTELQIDLSVKDAKFYGMQPILISSFDISNPMTFHTSDNQYNDVYIIYPGSKADSYNSRSNFVTKLYWSKSKGLVRDEKKDGVFWDLAN